MEIQPNSRQVPSIQEICGNKKYYDLLYSYLQCMSKLDEETHLRYIDKYQISFISMAKVFGIARQTMSNKFKGLIELGLIEELDNRYILYNLPEDYAYLIPKETLELIHYTLSENAISTYIYLFNRYLGADEQPYQFTLKQIKLWLGISTKTRSNDIVVTSILMVLKKIGLIEYRAVTKQDEDNFNNIKTVFELQWLKNYVQKC